MDEGHEVVTLTDDEHDVIADITTWKIFVSKYRWFVSGTPFPHNRASFVGILAFLNFSLESGKKLLSFYNHTDNPFVSVLEQAVKHVAYCRNTKDSVAAQTQISNVKEQIHMINLTPYERAIYDAATFHNSPSLLRSVCANPGLSAIIPAHLKYNIRLDDDSFPQRMIDHYSSEVQRIQQKIRSTKFKIAKVKPTDVKFTFIKEKIASWNNLVTSFTKDLIVVVSSSACFTRLLGLPESQTCKQCNIPTNTPSRTPCCRQLFCTQCISAELTSTSICPECKGELHVEQLNILLPDEPGIDSKDISMELSSDHLASLDPEKWKQELVHQTGSKLAAIAYHLYKFVTESDTSKALIFSQDNELQKLLIETLENYNPALFSNVIVTIKGNIHVKQKLLRTFNSEKPGTPRLLFLSTLNYASGTHLTVASHIVLIDSVVGSKEQAQAVDAQAIARAHRLGQDKPVTVVRFIVANTIDQTDYENAYGSIN